MPCKKNAFSFYLDEAVVELRRDEKVHSKHEAVPHAHRRWQAMSDAAKAPYEEMAKVCKLTKRTRRTGRLDNTGLCIDDRIDMDRLRHDQRRDQRKFLRDRWQKMRMEEVLDERFFIMSFQSRFEFPNEEGYQPVEVACVKFSLRGGISGEWHAVIDPGPMVIGMGAESKIFSEQTHQIPIWKLEAARNDYLALWNELLDFLNPGKRMGVYPPIFTKIEDLGKTTFCVEYLARLAGTANCLSKIFQWEVLPLTLYEHAGVAVPSLTIVEAGAATAMYDYEANTKCDYHHEIECVHCALLTVKKCCFFMSDAFTKIYDFEITENHLPVHRAPQFMVIPPQLMYFKKTERKRFFGANGIGKYDPNLPVELQQSAVSDVSDFESTSASSAYGSRDIRFRRNFRQLELLSVGRGTVTGNRRPPPLLDNQSDARSTADTNDDIGSSVFSDTESEATCQADDEGSVASERTKRPPLTAPQATNKLEVLFAPKIQKDYPETQPNSNRPQVYLSDDDISGTSVIDFTDKAKAKPVKLLQKKNDRLDSCMKKLCSITNEENVNFQVKNEGACRGISEQLSGSTLENVRQSIPSVNCRGRLTLRNPTAFVAKGCGIGRGLASKVLPSVSASISPAMAAASSVRASKDLSDPHECDDPAPLMAVL